MPTCEMTVVIHRMPTVISQVTVGMRWMTIGNSRVRPKRGFNRSQRAAWKRAPPSYRPEPPVGAAHQEVPHRAALLLVGGEKAPWGGAPEDESDRPSQVIGVLQPSVHTQATNERVDVGSVAGDEYPTARAAVPPSEAGVQFVGGEP